MNRFTVTDLPLAGLKLVERKRLGDNRGFLSRLFCEDELANAGWCQPIVQINHTYTSLGGTVRGLHYQLPPHAEIKLVSCIQGELWDVAVDLRANSPTYLQWHAEHLSSSNNRAMLIPEGFAHGFQTLVDVVSLIYLHSKAHSPENERALNSRDPRLAIDWPLGISEISLRDSSHPLIDLKFEGVLL